MAEAELNVDPVAETRVLGMGAPVGTGKSVDKNVAETSVGADSADWRAGIDNERVRGFAERFASPADLAKSALELRQKLSNAVVVPGDGASNEDKVAFHKALGVPEGPEGYEFAMPEGRDASEADKAFQGHMAKVFHDAGVPLSTSAALVAGWNDLALQYEAESARKDKAFLGEAEADLRKEWRGEDYERNVNFAARAVARFAGEHAGDLLDLETKAGRKLGNYPPFLKLMATVGRRMGEGGLHVMPTEGDHGSIEKRIQETREAKREATAKGDMTTVERLDKEELGLRRLVTPEVPIVGTMGRTV